MGLKVFARSKSSCVNTRLRLRLPLRLQAAAAANNPRKASSCPRVPILANGTRQDVKTKSCKLQARCTCLRAMCTLGQFSAQLSSISSYHKCYEYTEWYIQYDYYHLRCSSGHDSLLDPSNTSSILLRSSSAHSHNFSLPYPSNICRYTSYCLLRHKQ